MTKWTLFKYAEFILKTFKSFKAEENAVKKSGFIFTLAFNLPDNLFAMKSIYEAETLNEIKQRINKLKADAQRQWGKMDVAQMLAHCSAALEISAGQKFPPRSFIGRILGPFFKPMLSNEKPLQKNTPTDKSVLITDERVFEKEKERLLSIASVFSEGGEAKCTTHPHFFFGKLTPAEWGTGAYKHLDHHLRQFGV